MSPAKFKSIIKINQLPSIDPFFENVRIQPDNNAIKNKIRPLALGRKNFLFAT
jgi:hypothetical protein